MQLHYETLHADQIAPIQATTLNELESFTTLQRDVDREETDRSIGEDELADHFFNEEYFENENDYQSIRGR